MVSIQSNMPKTVTVLAQVNKVVDTAILSISVNMMNYKDFFVRIVPTIVTSFLQCFSSIRLVITGFSSIKRLFGPMRKATHVGAKFASRGVLNEAIAGDIKFPCAILAYPDFPSFVAEMGASARAKRLLVSVVFFGDKLATALLATIHKGGHWFSSILFKAQVVAVPKTSTSIFDSYSTTTCA